MANPKNTQDTDGPKADATLPRKSNKELFADYETAQVNLAAAKAALSASVAAIVEANEGKKGYKYKGERLTAVERATADGKGKEWLFKKPSAAKVVSV